MNYTDPTGHCQPTACVGYARELAQGGPLGVLAALGVLAVAVIGCGFDSECRAIVMNAAKEIGEAANVVAASSAAGGGCSPEEVAATGRCNMSQEPIRQSDRLTFQMKQIEKKFDKHASDFGISGNNNRQNREAFRDALKAHVDDASTQRLVGTYRGDNVVFYYNANSGNVVITDPNGNFVSGWALNADQAWNVLNRQKL